MTTEMQTAEPMTQLVDRAEISALIFRTARAMDTRDWTLLSTCYTPTSIGLFATGKTEGFEQIARQYQAFLTPLDVTQHLIGNVECAVQGDEAQTSCYFQAQHVRVGTEGGVHYLIGGRYDDRMVRTPEGWRIATRRVTGLWTQGNPGVVGATLKPGQTD